MFCFLQNINKKYCFGKNCDRLCSSEVLVYICDNFNKRDVVDPPLLWKKSKFVFSPLPKNQLA